MKHTYYIKGMSCQGCRNHVESALASLEGIEQVKVDLEKEEAVIEFNKSISLKDLQMHLSETAANYSIHKDKSSLDSGHSAATDLKDQSYSSSGYYYCPMQCEGEKQYPKPGDCPVCGMDLVPVATSDSSDLSGTESLTRKLRWAIVFTLPIFLIAMSEMIPANPIYNWLSAAGWNWVQMFLSIPVVFYSGWFLFQRAYKSIKSWNPNMFTLIGIGAGIAWIYSFAALLVPDFFPDQFKTSTGAVHVYFEAATVILTLVLLGQVLEARAHQKTSSTIRALLELAPNTANRIVNGQEIEVKIESIGRDDILRVKPGERIPVDGSILDGNTYVDESMVTGEPLAVFKEKGDRLMAGTINGNQSFLMRAERVGSDTLLAQIIQMVDQASRSRAPIQNLADKISAFFVPAVVLISLVTFVIWSLIGPSPAYVYALVNAIAVLIIACPCALGLATPMSVMVGVGHGAKIGVLFKNAIALQQLNQIDTLVIDKTGTITEGNPYLEKVELLNEEMDQSAIMHYAASLSIYSEHPLSDSIVKYSNIDADKLGQVEGFKSHPGKGISGKVDQSDVAIGNTALMELLQIELIQSNTDSAKYFQEQGKTVVFVAVRNKLSAFLVISDRIKENSAQVISKLRRDGMEVIMLTGDNIKTAGSIAAQLELSGFQADLSPEDKLRVVKELQNEDKVVAMAGDGINDAPALAKSDVGIAMGTGTDVAIESADITLVKGDLQGIFNARQLSKRVMINIRQNLFFALFYNALGVPIAAGVLYPVFGILLSPMIAALAMSFSSVSVIANALRLQKLKLTI